MNNTANISDTPETSDPIRDAQEVLKKNRQQGLARLNDLFRSGKLPPALDGPYEGELLAVTISPGIDQIIGFITSFWMPWQGKHLVLADSEGDNILKRNSRWLLRVLFPFYTGFIENDEKTFRAFAFKTSTGAGKVDEEIEVFKLDYNSPDNPALIIRPILDELVQVAVGVYLGKIHFKGWRGKWKMIGYFSLRKKD